MTFDNTEDAVIFLHSLKCPFVVFYSSIVLIYSVNTLQRCYCALFATLGP